MTLGSKRTLKYTNQNNSEQSSSTWLTSTHKQHNCARKEVCTSCASCNLCACVLFTFFAFSVNEDRAARSATAPAACTPPMIADPMTGRFKRRADWIHESSQRDRHTDSSSERPHDLFSRDNSWFTDATHREFACLAGLFIFLRGGQSLSLCCLRLHTPAESSRVAIGRVLFREANRAVPFREGRSLAREANGCAVAILLNARCLIQTHKMEGEGVNRSSALIQRSHLCMLRPNSVLLLPVLCGTFQKEQSVVSTLHFTLRGSARKCLHRPWENKCRGYRFASVQERAHLESSSARKT